MTPVLSAAEPVRNPVGLEAIFGSFGTVLFGLVVGVAVVLLVAAFLAERAATGAPSFVSLVSARLSARDGSPVWEAFPLAVVLAGLAVGLAGWRAYAGGPLFDLAQPLVIVGVGIALLGGVMAVALAHPPRSMEGRAPSSVAHPVQAHTAGPRSLFGSGPYGGVLVVAGGAVALVGLPLSVVWRALEGRSVGGGVLPVQVPLLAGVLAMAVGAWLLRAESRHATAATRPVGPRDVRETVGLTAVLLALSVVAGVGAPAALVAVPALAVLVLARLRLGFGGAALVVGGYVAGRVLAALFTGTLDGTGTVPFLVAAVAGALAVELLLVPAGDRPRGVPVVAPATGPQDRAEVPSGR